MHARLTTVDAHVVRLFRPGVTGNISAPIYHWQSAGSTGCLFPMLKYKYIFQRKHAEAILSKSTRKLLRSEIAKMLIEV